MASSNKSKRALKAFSITMLISFLLAHYYALAGGYRWGSSDFLHVLSNSQMVGVFLGMIIAVAAAESKEH